jgi:hypothetical protein
MLRPSKRLLYTPMSGRAYPSSWTGALTPAIPLPQCRSSDRMVHMHSRASLGRCAIYRVMCDFSGAFHSDHNPQF